MNTYLFDFDGTLVDSMPTYVAAMLRILDENHIPYGDDLVRIITPLGVLGTAEYYVGTLGVNMDRDELISAMKAYMYDAYCHTIPAKENVVAVLQALKNRGAGLNVLTASPHVTLDPCLRRLGIFDLFDNVWSCDDFGTTKADPAIYEKAARRLGKAVSEVLFLDDNLNADTTAKQAGMKVCGVYDASSAGDEAAIRAVADGYIRDFSELLTLEV